MVVLLTTSPQESMGRKNTISPQFEDEEIQKRLWDTFQQECLWEGVTKLNYLPVLRPHESRRILQKKLVEILKSQEGMNQWKYLWETPGKCRVCHTETDSVQPIQYNRFRNVPYAISRCIMFAFLMTNRQFRLLCVGHAPQIQTQIGRNWNL